LKQSMQHLINEALKDPNLTQEDRTAIDVIHLNAMHRAKDIANSREDRGEYARALDRELEKHEAEILMIRGRAANRKSRRVENY